MPANDYWSAIAQVIPVVALGVVVEVRQITGRWDVETPRFLRIVQSTLWASVLIVLAFAESAALTALRGERVSSWWPEAAESAIQIGLGVLVISPALEFLVSGHAEFLARVATPDPSARVRFLWRLRCLERGRRAIGRRLEEDRLRLTRIQERLDERASELDESESLLDYANESENKTTEAGATLPIARPEVLAARKQGEDILRETRPLVSETRAVATELSEDLDSRTEEHADAMKELTELRRFYREDIRKAAAKDREDLTGK